MLVADEKSYKTIGPYVASAIAHVIVLILANQPGSELEVKTEAENAIQVEIVDSREWPERSAKEPSKRASNQQEYTGKADEAVASAPPPEAPPVKKPEQIGNGWRHSVEILSNAELSKPNPRTKKLVEKLSRLETGTMFVQLCNLEAILQISRSEQEYRPEGVIAYATADISTEGDMIIANGAALQSKGQWYNLSFRCRVSAAARKVRDFEFAIGSAIPKSDWASHNLPRQSIGLAGDEGGG